MSLFTKLLDSSGKSWHTPPTELTIKESNAKVYSNFSDFGLPNLTCPLMGDLPIDIMASMGALRQQYLESFIPCETKGFHYLKLLEDGILKIPVVLKIAQQSYALFYIYDEKGVRKFNDAKKKLAKTAYPNALYLSTFDIDYISARSNCLQVLSISDLVYQEYPVGKGQYAIWWPTDKDTHFHSSKTRQYLQEIYQGIDGYQSYFLGYLLSELKVNGFEKFQRVALPNQQQEIIIKGPENKNLIFSFCNKKGIGIHFPIAQCDQTYRERFLEQICNAIQAFTLTLQLRDVPQDLTHSRKELEWFSLVKQNFETINRQGNDQKVIGALKLR